MKKTDGADAVRATKAAVLKGGALRLILILTRAGLRLMSVVGPSRQAAFYGSTVANGALRTWLDLQLAPPCRKRPITDMQQSFAVTHTGPTMW
jgi:hypothetical protein